MSYTSFRITERRFDTLKGNVKSTTETTYSVKILNGKVTKWKKKETKYNYETYTTKNHYDLNGNLTREEFYFSDSLDHAYYHKYDLKNNLVEFSYFDKIINAKYIKNRFTYDENNNKIKWEAFDENGNIRHKHEYQYNSLNKLIRQTQFNKKNQIVDDEIITYKNKRKHISEKINHSFYPKHQKTQTFYTYANNRLIKESTTYKGQNIRQKTYTYDSLGNHREILETEPKNDYNFKQKFKYNSYKVLIEHLKYNRDNLILKETYTYDKNNNLVEASQFQKLKNSSLNEKYVFKLDNKGNWIERIKYSNNRPQYICERQIEYRD